MNLNVNHNRNTIYFPLALIFCVVLSVPFLNAQESETTKTPLKKDELKTIIVDSYYPYTYVNEDGVPDGFSIDLAEAVSHVMGMKLNVMVDAWERARFALENGTIDLLPMMAYSKERDKLFDFSVPHTIAYDALFTRADTEIKSIRDLPGKRIIVMENDQAHDYLISNLDIDPENIILIHDLPRALRLLSSGKGDVALMPKLVGLMVCMDLNLTNIVKNPAVIEDYNRPFSFAVKEGNQLLLERLSQGLSIVKNSGQYDEIYERWFAAIDPRELSLKSVLKYLAGIFLVFLAVGFGLSLWSFSLRKQVAARTKKLEDQAIERRQADEALRESEEKYRTILDIIDEAYFEVDFEGNYTFFNDALSVILGYSRDELSKMNYLDYMSPETAREAYQVFVQALETGKPIVKHNYEITKRDGTRHFHELAASLMRDKNGVPIGFRGVARDITERRRAEEEKVKLVAQLHQAQKTESIGTLAGGIAHDFNNILGVIMGCTELSLHDTPEETPIHGHLTTALEATNRAKDLVRQILTFSRQDKQEERPLAMGITIEEALKMLRSSLPATIEIRQNIEKDAGLIMADPTQIHQIIMNLSTNAAHAMKETGGVLNVSVSDIYIDAETAEQYQDLTSGPHVMLTVSDTGHGMEREVVERIFEPYYTTKEIGEGTGLGLSVVHGIVQSHNGAINVHSEREKGTTFEILFPKIDLAETRTGTKEQTYIPAGTERILFVDDEPAMTKIYQSMLERLGYTVTTRTSSLEALDAFRAQPDRYDLVITDQTMPHVTGQMLAKEIMTIRPDIPVILCTGHSDLVNEERAKEMGIQAFVMKPIAMAEIANTIRNVLDKRNYEIQGLTQE